MDTTWWQTLLSDAGSTLLAALIVTCSYAQLKAMRVNGRLDDIYDVLQRFHGQIEKQVRHAHVTEGAADIKSQIEEIKTELDRASDGVLMLSRRLRRKIAKLDEQVNDLVGELYGARITEILNGDSRSSEMRSRIAALQSYIDEIKSEVFFLEFFKA